MVHFVYGNKKRIFINTTIGCLAHCKYCYLPEILEKQSICRITAKEALEKLHSLNSYSPGPNGTIISIGCYSECWDDANRKETLELLSNISKEGNYIQLATKRKISLDDLLKINSFSRFKNQIGIHLSVPTISHSPELEPGTDPILNRLSPLNFTGLVTNVYFALYIKPVIKDITIEDIENYKRLVQKYSIPVIVGSMLEKPPSPNLAVQVGEGKLQEVQYSDNDLLIRSFLPFDRVYKHSIDIIEDFRKLHKEKKYD